MQTMQIVAITALLTGAACSSGAGAPSLDGTWIYETSGGTAGKGLTFKSDGTYALSDLQETSPTSVEAEIETGTFITSGTTITATPREFSCAGPVPVWTFNYSFSGADLELADTSGAIVYQPDTSTATTGVAIAIGCFTSNGFVAEALAPVSN
jgi:hypothetical protein